MEIDIEIRNPKYNTSGTIDCEINHPKYGWIEFTANPKDVEEHGRSIYQYIIEGNCGEITPLQEPLTEV